MSMKRLIENLSAANDSVNESRVFMRPKSDSDALEIVDYSINKIGDAEDMIEKSFDHIASVELELDTLAKYATPEDAKVLKGYVNALPQIRKSAAGLTSQLSKIGKGLFEMKDRYKAGR